MKWYVLAPLLILLVCVSEAAIAQCVQVSSSTSDVPTVCEDKAVSLNTLNTRDYVLTPIPDKGDDKLYFLLTADEVIKGEKVLTAEIGIAWINDIADLERLIYLLAPTGKKISKSSNEMHWPNLSALTPKALTVLNAYLEHLKASSKIVHKALVKQTLTSILSVFNRDLPSNDKKGYLDIGHALSYLFYAAQIDFDYRLWAKATGEGVNLLEFSLGNLQKFQDFYKTPIDSNVVSNYQAIQQNLMSNVESSENYVNKELKKIADKHRKKYSEWFVKSQYVKDALADWELMVDLLEEMPEIYTDYFDTKRIDAETINVVIPHVPELWDDMAIALKLKWDFSNADYYQDATDYWREVIRGKELDESIAKREASIAKWIARWKELDAGIAQKKKF